MKNLTGKLTHKELLAGANLILEQLRDAEKKLKKVEGGLSPEQKIADTLLWHYLRGYSGVIAHACWSGLRDSIAALIQKKRVQRKK